ncbi:MAG: sigma-70 factor domain-containing protein [Gemmatimonadota bacterium]
MALRRDATGALGQYLSEIREHPLVSRDEEIRLAHAIRAGDEGALDRLVAANLRFVPRTNRT